MTAKWLTPHRSFGQTIYRIVEKLGVSEMGGGKVYGSSQLAVPKSANGLNEPTVFQG